MAIAPGDAEVALRSLPRRFRAVLVRGDDEDTDRPDHLVRRADGSGWSALDHAAHVARSLQARASALGLVLVQDEPVLSRDVTEDSAHGGPGGGSGSVAEVVGELEEAATSLAEQVARVAAADWDRAGVVPDGDGTRVRAVEIVDEAVQSAVAHLRAAAAVVDAVRGRE